MKRGEDDQPAVDKNEMQPKLWPVSQFRVRDIRMRLLLTRATINMRPSTGSGSLVWVDLFAGAVVALLLLSIFCSNDSIASGCQAVRLQGAVQF